MANRHLVNLVVHYEKQVSYWQGSYRAWKRMDCKPEARQALLQIRSANAKLTWVRQKLAEAQI